MGPRQAHADKTPRGESLLFLLFLLSFTSQSCLQEHEVAQGLRKRHCGGSGRLTWSVRNDLGPEVVIDIDDQVPEVSALCLCQLACILTIVDQLACMGAFVLKFVLKCTR